MRTLARRCIAFAVVTLAVLASRVHDPRISVENCELVPGVPALHFVPRTPGPHPRALLAHGVSASKETLYRFGEALSGAGIECWAIDLPGHGESPLRFPGDNAEVVARAVHALGRIDVFLGHSMGAYAGGAAVRDGRLSPRLFVSVGALPELGERPPEHLLLAGRFEEAVSPRLLARQRDATLIVSGWSDHALEPYDSTLIRAALERARPGAPPASSRWVFRLLAVPLSMGGALWFALSFQRARGVLVALLVLAALALSGGTWLSVVPTWGHFPAQLVAMLVAGAGAALVQRLHLPLWALVLPGVGLVLECAVFGNPFWSLVAGLATLVTALGVGLGTLAARVGRPLDAVLGFGIFVGYAVGQWLPVFY